jgi:hypothetical protein
MIAVTPENVYCADAMHQGFDQLINAAKLLGESVEDVERYETAFWTAVLEHINAAGNA